MKSLDGQGLDKVGLAVNLEGLLGGLHLDDDRLSLMLASDIVGALVKADSAGSIDVSSVNLSIDLGQPVVGGKLVGEGGQGGQVGKCKPGEVATRQALMGSLVMIMILKPLVHLLGLSQVNREIGLHPFFLIGAVEALDKGIVPGLMGDGCQPQCQGSTVGAPRGKKTGPPARR